MAQTILCEVCRPSIYHDLNDGIVEYMCQNIEHEECYFDTHPHNLICVSYGVISNYLLFKY